MCPQRVDTILLEVSNTRDLGSRHTGQEISPEEEGGVARLGEGSGESVRSTVMLWSLGGVATEDSSSSVSVRSITEMLFAPEEAWDEAAQAGLLLSKSLSMISTD